MTRGVSRDTLGGGLRIASHAVFDTVIQPPALELSACGARWEWKAGA
jgi:hypothetical protein